MSAGGSPSTEQKLVELTGRLRREYAAYGVPAAEVEDVIAVVRAGFVDATVLAFVPVLVERGVRDRLGRPRPRSPEPVALDRVGSRAREGVVRSVRLRLALWGAALWGAALCRVALWGPGVRR